MGPQTVMTGRVMRWSDGWVEKPLPDELRSRPGVWAVVAEQVHRSLIESVMRDLGLPGGDFEKRAHAVDDGDYGLIYEVEARYWPESERDED